MESSKTATLMHQQGPIWFKKKQKKHIQSFKASFSLAYEKSEDDLIECPQSIWKKKITLKQVNKKLLFK